MKKQYSVTGTPVPFFNNVSFCVGTGHAGLALRREYYEQLKLVQSKIGFKHIRGHGLFTDDMAIYQERRDREGNVTVEYNFIYLDMIMDMYRELNIKPFLELGFMPQKLASGEQTIFYWKGNTTPPRSYEGWAELVKATLSHLCERYGADEAVTYPIEVWNEPNLPGFWRGADLPEYCRLYEVTARAVKEVDERFRVGGPAICGVNDVHWMTEFLDYCQKTNSPIDFITRHHYTIHQPTKDVRYDYCPLQDPDDGFSGLHKTREIVDSYPEYKGFEIHITEFNTSYTPASPIHDTNKNAAYVAHLLSRLGEDNYSYSYWTFGDVFEEWGAPFSEFHGGFGLVANHCIPKPTMWTFAFYRDLEGLECVHKSKNAVICKTPNGEYRGVIWNIASGAEREVLDISFDLPAEGERCVITKTVDEDVCNPLKAWHDIGEPKYLTETEADFIKQFSNPLYNTHRIGSTDGKLTLDFTVKGNGVTYFETKTAPVISDRGYDYERVMKE